MQSLLDLFRGLKQVKYMSQFNNIFMEKALGAAREAAQRGEVPVGAVIVDANTQEILATNSNRVLELKDPTAHAEMLAIKEACSRKNSERLIDCDLYVTLEPCPMCAQAISFARIRRLYFGASDEKGGGVENGAIVFNAKSCHHKPEVYGDIMSGAAAAMLKDFFKDRR